MRGNRERRVVESIGLGSPAPPFELLATDGERYTLESFSRDQLLVLVFLANHCPYVVGWEDRIITLAVEHMGRGAAFAAINSVDSRQHAHESYEESRRRAHDKQYPFPYLLDESGSLARALGATITPEAFVFDHQRRLRYHGAIDSDVHEAKHPVPYLRTALEGLIAGGSTFESKTQLVGCPLEVAE